MTVYVGPGIVSEGLIFHYNTDSEMTFKGKPTVNLWCNQAGVSDLNEFDSWSMPGVPGASSTITKDYGLWNGSTKSSIWKVTVGTGTMQSYASWRLCLDTGLTSIATTRRLQAKVKMIKGSISDLGYHNGGGTGGATYTAIDPGEIPGGVTDNTGWYQLSLQVNWTSTSVGQCVGIGILSQDIEFLVAEPMIATDTTFTVPYTPNERINTGVLYDATGKNTITATDLIYNSDGTVSYDGTTGDQRCVINAGTELLALKGSSAITVEAWVYYTSYSGGAESYSVITNSGSPWVWLLENPSQRFRFRASIGGSDVSASDPDTHALNTWYHVVGTYNGANHILYVNGVEKANRADTGVLGSPTYGAYIGTYQGTNYCMSGKIDDVKIYNVALTAKQVEQNFEAGRYTYGI